MSNTTATKHAALWTKPYHGVQHLGRANDPRWVTLTDIGSMVEVTFWTAGCGFHPEQADFDTLAEAMAAGERFVSEARH